MRHRGLALGLLFVSAASAAQAQTVISREISNEPVETVVTTGPNGTVITKRPLAPGAVATVPAPVVTAPAPVVTPPFPFAPLPPLFSEPSTTVVETVQTVEQPAVVEREVIRPAARRAMAQAVLTPQQRRVVYRTILLEQARPALAQQVVTAPLSIAPPATVRTVTTAPVVERVSYVGATLPRDVIVYDMPASVAVPAVRPYRYAIMDDRVLLVDPATRIVVEDLTP